MARSPDRPLNVNKTWWEERIKAVPGIGSQKAFGEFIGLDQAQVTQFLTGRQRGAKGERRNRTPDIWELAAMATALKTTTDEVLRNIGIPVEGIGVPLAGRITDDCRAYVTAPRGDMLRVSAPDGAQALVMQTESAHLAPYNGAYVVYLPTVAPDLIPAQSIGSLSVVEVDDELTPFLGVLRKASRDRYSFELFGGKEKFEVRTPHRASPVHSIHFP